MTDWHTHILPGMDDGSRDAEESLDMLAALADQQVSEVVMTPHFYAQAESPARFLKRRRKAQEQLAHAIESRTAEGAELPSCVAGVEVYYFDQLWQLDAEELRALCIGSSNILMVEMPETPWETRVYDTLEKLMYRKSVIPLIAHVDRCMDAITDSQAFDRLIADGLLVQLNTAAFEGMRSKRKAFRWMKSGRVHRIGSDCHNMQNRKPDIASAVRTVQKSLGEEAVRFYFAPVSETKR